CGSYGEAKGRSTIVERSARDRSTNVMGPRSHLLLHERWPGAIDDRGREGTDRARGRADGLPGHRAIDPGVLLDAADARGDCAAPDICACVRVGPGPGLAADRPAVAEAESRAAHGRMG